MNYKVTRFWKIVLESLPPRLFNMYIHLAYRDQQFTIALGPNADLDDSFRAFLDGLGRAIQALEPCEATSIFPHVGEVDCENEESHHGQVHQSSKSYPMPSTSWFGWLLGKTVPQACHWYGSFSSRGAVPNFAAEVTK